MLVVLGTIGWSWPRSGAGPIAWGAPTGPAIVAQVAGGSPAEGPDGPVVYAAPVDAPVIDRFRPPATPYGAGNRGWEYATLPGTAVRAAGRGTVSFAGPVGGRLAVTVAHPDGLRTSYTDLAAIAVRAGEEVAGGDVLGTAGSRLHVGVRRGDVYLDPAGILPEPGATAPPPAAPPVVRLRPVGR